MKMKKSLVSLSLTLVLCTVAQAAVEPLDLVKPVADYKIYVSKEVNGLVAQTQAFTDAVKAGDLAKAKALYAPTRAHYERIEPIAELFSDLDSAIDSRADDHEKRERDSAFVGFHRIEYGLFSENSTKDLAPVADKLMHDVIDLQRRVSTLVFPPSKVVGGAAALMEEVAATKISGEEDRYSHTDLWDFQANVDGAQKIVQLLDPLIRRQDAEFAEKISTNFATVDNILAKYRTQNGFEPYDKLSANDRRALVGPVQTLAEDLSRLRGMLGLK
ncbi:MAG TPA: iron uptake system protein EfeO [Trinickia sp.]|jgi:iron uptake system component EfeO|uniref:iron uptake system protein EfeO n=1 Tax=Trinickia sp. TaxID=2571163 RepID=UPI002B91FFE8|nr:iron uptake system protein EfeO [Trinickia sp.]HTI18026.1 iron uptake system protein EfeO [Trinickia sp.]